MAEETCDVNELREEKALDLTTEEGRKAFIERKKEGYKRRYEYRTQEKLREELEEQARLEAIKELGVTEEDYDKAFNNDRLVERIRTRSSYADLADEGVAEVVKHVRDAQLRQNQIVESMINKDAHVDVHKRNLRNAMVTEYIDLEKIKSTYLDILSSTYLKSEECMKIVNERGGSFAKAAEDRV